MGHQCASGRQLPSMGYSRRLSRPVGPQYFVDSPATLHCGVRPFKLTNGEWQELLEGRQSYDVQDAATKEVWRLKSKERCPEKEAANCTSHCYTCVITGLAAEQCRCWVLIVRTLVVGQQPMDSLCRFLPIAARSCIRHPLVDTLTRSSDDGAVELERDGVINSSDTVRLMYLRQNTYFVDKVCCAHKSLLAGLVHRWL